MAGAGKEICVPICNLASGVACLKWWRRREMTSLSEISFSIQSVIISLKALRYAYRFLKRAGI